MHFWEIKQCLFYSVIFLNSNKCFLKNPQHARYLLDVWQFMGRRGRNEVSKMPIWQALPSNCLHARRQIRKSLIAVQKEGSTCLCLPDQSACDLIIAPQHLVQGLVQSGHSGKICWKTELWLEEASKKEACWVGPELFQPSIGLAEISWKLDF